MRNVGWIINLLGSIVLVLAIVTYLSDTEGGQHFTIIGVLLLVYGRVLIKEAVV